MVEKTYLRYTAGPQGGVVVGRASLHVDAALARPRYEVAAHDRRNRASASAYRTRVAAAASSSASPSAMLFLPSLEAVRVYSVKSGELIHTLIPAEAASAPVEVTALQVVALQPHRPSLHAGHGQQGPWAGMGASGGYDMRCDGMAEHGWMLMVGYAHGYVALFTCGPSNNYGYPMCRFYAMGHRADTRVLALALSSHRMHACSAGQDTDVTVWDVMSQEAAFRLRGHRGGVVAVRFVPSAAPISPRHTGTSKPAAHRAAAHGTADRDWSSRDDGGDDRWLLSAAADGLVKRWDVTLRQCVQTIVVSDSPLTAMTMDSAGRRLYCGMRENVIRVYQVTAEERSGVSEADGPRASARTVAPPSLPPQRHRDEDEDEDEKKEEEEEEKQEAAADAVAVVPHGTIARRYHKPITHLTFSRDGSFIMACTAKTIELFLVLTGEEVRRKVQRKRQRRRRGAVAQESAPGDGHTGRKRDDGAAAASSQPVQQDGDEAEEDADAAMAQTTAWDESGLSHRATAAEEVVPLRTYYFEEKVRSCCFVSDSAARRRRAVDDDGDDDDDDSRTHLSSNHNMLHIAVTFNTNQVQTYTTRLVKSARSGAATWSLDDLQTRHSFRHKGHASAIRRLCLTDQDTMLLSLSADKVMLWSVTTRLDMLERDFADASDFYDVQEANMARPDWKGSLHRVAAVTLRTLLKQPMSSQNTASSSAKSTAESTPTRASHTMGDEATCMAAVSSGLCCVGTQDGTVCLLNVEAEELLASEPHYHVGGVKDVMLSADKGGFVSVGADRRMILWTVSTSTATGGDGAAKSVPAAKAHSARGTATDEDGRLASCSKPLSSTRQTVVRLIATHEVELTEAPLFVRGSVDGKLLGVGLQNHTIQLLFADSLKPYLALFGHKLPPTAMDFSSDGTLVASVGMDKSLRFWGTDFGDCHRAIHAHDDYVTAVAFQPHTHYVFTASMDGAVKQWDGDNWTMIQRHATHQSGLWALAVSVNGTCVVSAGVDRCVRCLLRTEDILFPQEEQERMAQAAMDEEAAKRAAEQRLDSHGASVGGSSSSMYINEVGIVGQPTARTADAAERLMEALDLVSVERQRQQNPSDTNKHPLLLRCSEWQYLWSVVESIRPSEIRHALSALTSVHTEALLDFLEQMLDVGAVLNMETAARLMLMLLMPGPAQVAGAMSALQSTQSEAQGQRRLAKLRRVVSAELDRVAGCTDYNIAGLQALQRYLEDTTQVKFFDYSAIQGHKKRYHSRAIQDKSNT